MRLLSDCSLFLFNSLSSVVVGGTACNRRILQGVHKGFGIGVGVAVGITCSGMVIAIPLPSPLPETHNPSKNTSHEDYIRSSIPCPANIPDLVPLLVRDLPSYANRVSTRAQVWERSFNPRGVVIAAAQSEIDEGLNILLPLDARLPANEEMTAFALEQDLASHNLIPLFFTTLERQYVDNHVVRLQHYHWAFLSQTTKQKDPQWHLALMFSRLGDYPPEQPVAPPRESRQGSIGQALQLWLRDCNAGSVAGGAESLD